MTEQEIKSKVEGVLKKIAPEADLGQVPPDASLRDTLDIDSFDYLRFITELHTILKVDIPESDYPQLVSMRGIVSYLAARCK